MPDGASITFFDPKPTTSEEPYRATHSADWRWDASGGINPGWNYTKADRRVDVGEWLWDVDAGWTFGKETEHQLALSTAFCIYQEDESVCDTSSCGGCVQSTNGTQSSTETTSADEEALVTELRACCTLDKVARPIAVSSDHLDAAKQKAKERAEPFLNSPTTRFEKEAARGWQEAPSMDTDFRSLVAYRSAAAHGRGTGARQGLINGEINAQNAPKRANQLINKVNSAHERVGYTGDSLDAVIGEVGQIEKTLLSAQTWAENAVEAFDVESMSEGEQLKYAESGLEFAQGNLDDAEFYLDASSAGDANGTDQSGQLTTVYETLLAFVSDELDAIGDDISNHVAYAVRNARSHVERAEARRADEYLAAAVVDLVYAFRYVSSIPALRGADFDTVDNPTLEVEQELTADRFNRRAGSVSNSTERLMLRLARLEYNTGIESYGTFRAMDDRSEAERAFRHYVVTETLLGAVDELYDEFGLI